MFRRGIWHSPIEEDTEMPWNIIIIMQAKR